MTFTGPKDNASFQLRPQSASTHKAKSYDQAQMTLKGHEGGVYGVALIPGTRLLVTCATDRSLRMWNLDTGKQVGKPLIGHDASLRTVAASPNGRWIVSGGRYGSIVVWEVATQKCVSVSFKGHDSEDVHMVRSVVFAPDNETFASASDDKTVRVWLRRTGKTALGPLQAGSEAYSVSYSSDGCKLAAGTKEHIIVWNAGSGEELLKIEQGAVGVTFTPDDLRLVSVKGKGIRIYDAATGDILNQIDVHTHGIFSLAIAPNGTKIGTTSFDRTTRFFDLTTLEPIVEYFEHPQDTVIFCAAFSEDSQLIVTGSRNRLVHIWAAPQTQSEKTSQQSALKVPLSLHTCVYTDY
ncbi:WD40-repeat-containing domain protein [Suillus ampliporus]|nr:WD40-repeat-containing domain protein [Suillus ampliporus]